MISETEVFIRKKDRLLIAVGMTILTLLFINILREEILNWQYFNTKIIIKIFLLVILSVTILAWVRFFSNKPEFRITKEGIWYRKRLFTRKTTEFASWNNIEYFFVESVKQRGVTTEELIIKVKGKKKYLKLPLTGINISMQGIFKL